MPNKTSPNPEDLDKRFYINIGPGGTFRPSGNPEFDSSPTDIDNLFEQLRAAPQEKIVLYFHGGLVSLRNGVKSAVEMTKVITKVKGAHPVSFIWESGLIETVGNNLVKISDISLFDRLKHIIIKVITKKLGLQDGAKGAGGNGLTEAEINDELMRPEPFEAFGKQTGAKSAGFVPQNMTLIQEAALKGQISILVSQELQNDIVLNGPLTPTIPTEGIRGRGIIETATLIPKAVEVAFKVVKRFANKRDHGFLPTLIEEIAREFYVAEIGAWIWGKMKNKAEDMWNSNDGKQGLNQFAGRYFLDQLVQLQIEFPTLKIDLIGHSAGAVVVCYLLNTVRNASLNISFRNVIFLAPACRCDLFHDSIVKHKDDSLFSSFRMFTMKDEIECKDHLAPVLYNRSLLYLISGVLEDEGKSPDQFILGMQRFLLKQAPYDQIPLLNEINAYLNETGKNRQVFSVSTSTEPGLQCDAIKHGSFDDNPLTRQSISALIQI